MTIQDWNPNTLVLSAPSDILALEFVKKQVLAAVDALGYLYCGVREMRVANRELLDPDNESWLDCSFA